MALKAHSAFYLVRKQSLLFDRRKSFRYCLARSQEILLLCFLVFYIFHSAHPTGWAKSIREDIPKKSSCSFGFCPMKERGEGPAQIFCLCSQASQTPIIIHILKTYDERYSKIIREHKYKEIDRDKDTDKLPLSALFYFFSIFSSRSKILSLQKLPPFLFQYSSAPQTKNFVKLCLSPWTQYFSSPKVLCFYLLSPESFFRPPFFFSSTNQKFSFSSPFHHSSPIKQHILHDICPLLLPFSLLL